MFIALFALTSHLGRPFGAFWILLNFNFTSVIAYGSVLHVLFFIISILYALAVCSLSEDAKHFQEGKPGMINGIMKVLLERFKSEKLREKFGNIGVVIAVILGLYHGFLLMSFKSKAIWNTGILPVLTLGGFITTGIALSLLIQNIKARTEMKSNDTEIARNFLVIALLVQTVFVIIYIFSMFFSGIDGRAAMGKMVFSLAYGIPFWLIAFIAGLIVPTALGIKDIIKSRKSESFTFTAPLGMTICILLGGFCLRYIILLAGQ